MIAVGEPGRDPNLNRFAFDGLIKKISNTSLVKYLINDNKFSLQDAFEIANNNWEDGKSFSSMIYLIARDYEGEILKITRNEFKLTVNKLTRK